MIEHIPHIIIGWIAISIPTSLAFGRMASHKWHPDAEPEKPHLYLVKPLDK